MNAVATTRKQSCPATTPGATPLRLFTSFLRLGCTAFGGPAMVAYIRRMAVEQRRWLEAGAFDDGVALCQMIPGATAMQAAAYVGLHVRGVRGAAACFVGFGLPAFVLMMLLAALYGQARALPAVRAIADRHGTLRPRRRMELVARAAGRRRVYRPAPEGGHLMGGRRRHRPVRISLPVRATASRASHDQHYEL